MSEATVLLERSGGIARLTMNRPDAANAISLRFAREFRVALAEAEADSACHVLVLRGNAIELCLGGRVLGAADALAWGLVNEVHSDDDLLAQAEARALARENQSISAIAAHPDTRARIAAFAQRGADKR